VINGSSKLRVAKKIITYLNVNFEFSVNPTEIPFSGFKITKLPF